jgi:hypothetical protein
MLDMKKRKSFLVTCAAALAAVYLPYATHATPAQDTTCDRACLKDLAHQVLVSMTKHDAGSLPLARWYAATENGSPAAPGMLSLWRTVTRFRDPDQYVLDPSSGQVFFLAEIFEGDSPAVFFGRLKVEKRHLAELELYISRAKGESGLQFDPDGLFHLPVAWTTPVPGGQKATREELTRVARSVFDHSMGTPAGSPHCELVEMGGRVVENPVALKAILTDKTDLTQRAVKGGMTVPCTASDRPQDKHARVIVDEEQGVAVSLGIIPGLVYPSFIDPASQSTFVPKDMAAGFERLPKQMRDPNASDQDTGAAYTPVIRVEPSTQAVAELTKFYGNQVQGVQRYMEMQPVGGGSIWVPH